MQPMSSHECKRRNVPVPCGQDDLVRVATLIDIGRALDLLAAAVEQRGEYFVYVGGRNQSCLYATAGGPQCLVGRAFSLAGVADDDLEAMGHRGIRELYCEAGLPVRLTLGALTVLDAAQRAQDRGYAWGDALDFAVGVAEQYVDLLPTRRAIGPGERSDDVVTDLDPDTKGDCA
jgi:hypothetical protein